MLLEILNKSKVPSKKNQGAIDNLLPQFPKHMTKVLEQNDKGASIVNDNKYRSKARQEKDKS
jgi:hypothetical protein